MVLGNLYGLGLGAKLDAMGNRASKTASQLETLIIEQLRLAYPDCDTQLRIMVKPIDGPGAWMAEAVPYEGASVTPACQRAKSSIAQRLRRRFNLASRPEP